MGMKKVAVYSVAGLILAYYLFTSGFVFKVTGGSKVDMMDTPYSIALSNQQLGFVGIYNEDDIACAKWIADNTDVKIPVQVDYIGMSLMIDYTGYVRAVYDEIKGRHYLFINTWDTKHGKMVYGWIEAAREYQPLPDLSGAKEVFRQGDAVVYEIGG